MIAALGYDPPTRTLRVTFAKNNQTWDYSGVPPEQFRALRDAGSLGQYFARHIRDVFPASQA